MDKKFTCRQPQYQLLKAVSFAPTFEKQWRWQFNSIIAYTDYTTDSELKHRTILG